MREKVVNYVQETYLNLSDNPEIFLTSARKTLETMLADFITMSFDDELKIKEVLKQSLDAQIAILYKKNKISSKLSSYMQIIRISGNYGTHFQTDGIEMNFVQFCDNSFRYVIKWYMNDVLKSDYSIDEVIDDLSKTKFVVHTNTKELNKKREDSQIKKDYIKKRKWNLFNYEFIDVIKQISVMVIMSLILYFFINK